MTLEERIGRLEDIEAIRYLQAKYQRYLDSRDFDSLAECFTVDAKSSYGNNKMSYNGRDAIIKFLADVMSINMPSAHLIHGGEIDWIDSENAKGTWYLEDHLLHERYLVKLNGAAIYHVEYKKIENRWLISSIGYERCYEYVELRGPVNLFSLRKKTILKKVKKANIDELGEYGKYYQYHTLRRKKKWTVSWFIILVHIIQDI